MAQQHELEALARTALAEITTAQSVGALAGVTEEGDGVVSLAFACTSPGYPGWHWTVSIAQLPDAEPSVLEAELLPGDGALLAPDWVPWADRLADYEAMQAALAAEREAEDESGDDESDDDDDPDADDDHSDEDVLDDDEALLHSGDLDGVDIDDLDDFDEDDDSDGDDDEEE